MPTSRRVSLHSLPAMTSRSICHHEFSLWWNNTSVGMACAVTVPRLMHGYSQRYYQRWAFNVYTNTGVEEATAEVMADTIHDVAGIQHITGIQLSAHRQKTESPTDSSTYTYRLMLCSNVPISCALRITMESLCCVLHPLQACMVHHSTCLELPCTPCHAVCYMQSPFRKTLVEYNVS